MEEGVFFPGSKAPGGTGTRDKAKKAEPSVSVPEEFFGGSKSGPMQRKPTPTPTPTPAPNEPNQNLQQQGN